MINTVYLVGNLDFIKVEKVIREIEEIVKKHFEISDACLDIVLLFSVPEAEREAAITLGNYLLYKKALHKQSLEFVAVNIGIVCYNALPAFMVSASRRTMMHAIFDMKVDYSDANRPSNKSFADLITRDPMCTVINEFPCHVQRSGPIITTKEAFNLRVIHEII